MIFRLSDFKTSECVLYVHRWLKKSFFLLDACIACTLSAVRCPRLLPLLNCLFHLSSSLFLTKVDWLVFFQKGGFFYNFNYFSFISWVGEGINCLFIFNLSHCNWLSGNLLSLHRTVLFSINECGLPFSTKLKIIVIAFYVNYLFRNNQFTEISKLKSLIFTME